VIFLSSDILEERIKRRIVIWDEQGKKIDENGKK
jgi:hypothetical protein